MVTANIQIVFKQIIAPNQSTIAIYTNTSYFEHLRLVVVQFPMI